MSVINICLYLYLILKPYYFKTSGSLQISDTFILIAFIFTIINLPKHNMIDAKLAKNYKLLLIFFTSIILINTIYYGIYDDVSFIKSSLYYVFIGIGIFIFIFKYKDEKLLKNYYIIFIIDIIIQIVIYLLGVGKYLGTTRYMGTFNDPNQFGFFMIMAIMYMYTIENILKLKRRAILIYIIAIYLIIASSSMGMLLALGTFLLIQPLYIIGNFKKIIIKHKNKIFLIIGIVIILAVFIILLYNIDYGFRSKAKDFINENILESQIFMRVLQKTDKLADGANSFLEDRHLDKFFNNLQYVLYGAGEGNWSRFGNNNGEIHSTLPSILFCYGILPTIILLKWIYNNLKGLKLRELSVYIAILIESFTLINHRQLIVWFLIILANCYKIKERNERNI